MIFYRGVPVSYVDEVYFEDVGKGITVELRQECRLLNITAEGLEFNVDGGTFSTEQLVETSGFNPRQISLIAGTSNSGTLSLTEITRENSYPSPHIPPP